jgi:predicted DCC family thiol-disulfide oxidoreductase YuxK
MPLYARTEVPDPPSRPLLVYDGDCGFCLFWLARWRRTTGDRIDYRPYHEVAERFPTLPRERFRRAVQLLEPDGVVSEGPEAVFRALARAPGHGGWLWAYERVPGARAAFDVGYRFVARHRPGLYQATRLAFGDQVERPLTSGAPRRLLLSLAGLGLAIVAAVAWRRRRRAGRSR